MYALQQTDSTNWRKEGGLSEKDQGAHDFNTNVVGQHGQPELGLVRYPFYWITTLHSSLYVIVVATLSAGLITC